MKKVGFLTRYALALAVLATTFLTAAPLATAQMEDLLWSFNASGDPNSTDGTAPQAGLIFDSDGNLYGTTATGGTYGYGTVFELIHKTGSVWTERILHSFNPNGTDGTSPFAALIIDSSGHLYGTTYFGGSNGDGTVFELLPEGGGWGERILHSFSGTGSDGANPAAGLVIDAQGNLYGTTSQGGTGANCTFGCGAAFELTRKAESWVEKTLHSFTNNGTDGYNPEAGLAFDAAGNLYGTAFGGDGANCDIAGCGIVFELSPTATGPWTETLLHSFNNNGTDGYYPAAAVTLDASGNIYGTTYGGGLSVYGTAFELTSASGGTWKESILYNFGGGYNPANPHASLTLDGYGNLYGTTISGCFGGCLFELVRSGGGCWVQRVLLSFDGYEGYEPLGDVTLDSSGNLYGTTSLGGDLFQVEGYGYGFGVVFEVTP